MSCHDQPNLGAYSGDLTSGLGSYPMSISPALGSLFSVTLLPKYLTSVHFHYYELNPNDEEFLEGRNHVSAFLFSYWEKTRTEWVGERKESITITSLYWSLSRK